MALGASGTEVGATVVRRSCLVALVGVGLGLSTALLAGRGLDSLIYGVSGTDPATFVAAANGITPFLNATGAVLSRTLSVDATGLWTDHIVWTSMSAAKTAAADMMQQPEAEPFMALIAPQTVTLRHAPIRFAMQRE